MQIFYLSRQPYFVAPVTFATLEAKAKRAITNYDQFEILGSVHAQGMYVCSYMHIDIYTMPLTSLFSIYLYMLLDD